MSTTPPPVIVLIPAYREGARIAATVRAARALPGVSRVLVIDDGSPDDTAAQAETAGAEVLRLRVNGGKGAAMRAGLAACPGDREEILLLLDADLGATASEAAHLLLPVLAHDADLAIARFPKATGKAGFGLVKGLARTGTWLLTRNWLAAPISGQRACRRWVLEAAPIADGYGVEVAMNVAAGDAGARIVEVPVAMAHNATGRTISGFKHRGRQFAHILTALVAAAVGRTGERCLGRLHPLRVGVWLLALILTFFTLTQYLRGQGLSWREAVALSLPGALPGPLFAALFSGLWAARKRNFQQRYLPALGGLLVLPVSTVLLLVAWPSMTTASAGAWTILASPFLVPLFLLGWLALGIIDDLKGDADRKGFRGHVHALLHGKLTTGGMKLLAGGLLSLGMALIVGRTAVAPWFITVPIAALLIALSANAMNLFDLRPGRALKVFWSVALPLLVYAARAADQLPTVMVVALFLLVLATLAYAPLDFAGMMMLGDTGANPLGALLGVCLALQLPVEWQAAAVVALVALHIYAERASLTALIERTRVLRWLDQLGRG